MRKYVFKAINLFCVEGFLAFEYVFIVFFDTNLMIIYVCTSKSLKISFKTGFSVHDKHLNLCWHVENSK